MQKKNQEKEIIKCTSLDDAKKIVYDKREAGINPRIIAQITFLINDQEKRFNIPQIAKIVKDNEIQTEESNPKEPGKSLMFKLFREGLEPVGVVIQTDMSVDYVREAHQEYLNLTNQTIFSKDDIDWYHQLILPYRKSEDPYELGLAIQSAVRDALNYRKLNYPCTNCGEIIKFTTTEIEWVRDKLSDNWGHSKYPDDY